MSAVAMRMKPERALKQDSIFVWRALSRLALESRLNSEMCQ